MSAAEVLCPRCGEQLDPNGMCMGENPDAPHEPALVADAGPPAGGYPGPWQLDGDLLTGPWRYRRP